MASDLDLLPGESLKMTARLHPLVVYGRLLLLGLMVAGASAGSLLAPDGLVSFPLRFAAIGCLWSILLVTCLAQLVIMKTSSFAVTSHRIIIHVGLMQRRSYEMLLSQVESVSLRRGPGRLLFDYGTVFLVGAGGTQERFPGIKNPEAFRRTVMQNVITDKRDKVPPRGGQADTSDGML